MLLKKDILAMFRSMKKINEGFVMGFFGEDGVPYKEFVLVNSDRSFIAYSKRPKGVITSSCIIGADDIEYIEEAIKNADAKDELYFSLDEETLSLNTLETLYYKFKVKLVEEEISLPNIKNTINKSAKELKDHIKLVSTLTDKKGTQDIPYIYVEANQDFSIYSFSGWVATKYKVGENVFTSTARTIKFEPEDIDKGVNLLPTGKAAEAEIALVNNSLVFIFNNCEIYISGKKNDSHSFLPIFFNTDNYYTKVAIDRDKCKTMLGKFKGVFGDTNGKFISIEREDEQFAKLIEGEEAYKVPYTDFTGNYPVNIYARYLKEASGKISSDVIILLVSDNIVRVVSENQDVIVTSMVKRNNTDTVAED